MDNLFFYLLELNITLVILFIAYRLFFERDKNFVVRRIYLLGVVAMPLVLPLLPEGMRMPLGNMTPVTFNLEEITVFAAQSSQQQSSVFTPINIMMVLYLLVLSLGLLKLGFQTLRITLAIFTLERFSSGATTLMASKTFHASSFFGYIFMDPAQMKSENYDHIIEHEMIHKQEWHSIDRILVELYVIMNWFSPVAWMLRRSVIQNLEFLADSAVIRNGSDPLKYQLSILNQYIGSASISNQFSSQIKNRINMLNRDNKPGSSWKLAMIIPLAMLAFFFVSCTEKETALPKTETGDSGSPVASELFYVVEEMPAFNGGEPVEFRKYIAQNVNYPKEAATNGVSGKVFIKFIVTSEGNVVVPDQKTLAKLEGKPLDEVVVVAYRPLEENTEAPGEEYIQMLKDEAVRVISTSPDWAPGKQRGKAVNVVFTFPIVFALQ